MSWVVRLALIVSLQMTSCGAFQTPSIVQGSVGLSGSLQGRHKGKTGSEFAGLKPESEAHPQRGVQILVSSNSRSMSLRRLPLPSHVANLRGRLRHFPTERPILLRSSAMHPGTPTRIMTGMAMIFGLISIARSIPGTGNVLANCAAGFVGGIAALTVSTPDEMLIGNHLGETMAAQGLIKGLSAGSYSTLMALVSTCSAGCGFWGIALASLGTGLIVGMCQKAIERANALGGGMPLLKKLRAKASHGFFTQNGLFGRSAADGLADWVVQYEAFFLSYAALVTAFPWMGLTLAGTAVSGALSGMASMAASAVLKGASNLASLSRQCREWWRGKQELRCSRILDECSTTAVKNSVLFVAYKAAYDALMFAL